MKRFGLVLFGFFLSLSSGPQAASEAPPPLGPAAYSRFAGLWNDESSRWERPRPAPPPELDAASGPLRVLRSAQTLLRPPGVTLRSSLSTGRVPSDAASGDFDGDGLTDVALANGLDNTLWIYPGSSEGGLGQPRVIPLAGRSPVSVEAVDLQNDGLLDLVVCLVDSPAVAVLLGEGGGSFSEEWIYPVPARCGDTASRDFDGDGAVDVAVGFFNPGYHDSRESFNVGDGLGFLKGEGDGRLQPLRFEKTVLDFPVDRITPFDMDADGDFDLLAVSSFDGVFVFSNDGQGRFTRGPSLDVGLPDNPLTTAAAADLDGDGCPDIVVAFHFGQVRRKLGSCNGVFRNQELWQYTGNVSLVSQLVDVDGDGVLDFVAAGARMTVMKGDGRGNLGRARVFRGEPAMVAFAAGDFDGDGDVDLFSVNQSTDTATVFQNDGSGDFGAPRGLETSDHSTLNGSIMSPGGPRFADLNRDGRLDVVFVEEGRAGLPHLISAVLAGPDGKLGEPIRSQTFREPRVGGYLLGDFRNSGKLDLVAVGQYELFIPGWQFLAFAPGNGDGTFGATRMTRPEGSGGMLVAGDFNRDGRLDIVTAGNESANSYRLRVTPFLGNGDGTFAPGTKIVFGGGGWPAAFHAADFNADGKLDLLVWAYDNSYPFRDHGLYQLLGNGDGTFQPARKLHDLFRPFAVDDLNGDGLPDLVTSKDFITDYPELTKVEIEVWLCRQDGSFEKTATYRPFPGITFFPLLEYGITNCYDYFLPRLGDFNGDGLTDIAAFQYVGGDRSAVQFLLGKGDGSFQPAFSSVGFANALAPQVAVDLDGDGFTDLLEIGFGEIDVLPGGPGPAFEFELTAPEVFGTRGYGVIRLALPSDRPTVFAVSSSSAKVRAPATVEIAAGRLSAVVVFDISPGHDWREVFELSVSGAGQRMVRQARQARPSVLYFPQVADGVGASLRFRTGLNFANTGDEGRVRVEFFASDSSPMDVDLEGLGARSVVEAPMKKGTSVSLETKGTGPLRSGYARVTIFGAIGGTAVFSGIDPAGGAVLFEAGVPLTRAGVDATIPVDSLNGYQTGVAIVNTAGPRTPPGGGEARMAVRLYDRSFEPVREGLLDLDAGQQTARFIDQMFDGPTANGGMRGALTIGSDRPTAVVALRQRLGTGRTPPTLTAFPVAAGRADAPIFDLNGLLGGYSYIPQVGDGSDGSVRFQTSLVLVNTGVDGDVNLHFFDSAGRPMTVELEGHGKSSSFFFRLWEGESLAVRTAGKGPLRAGYARVQALRNVSGTAIFTASDAVDGEVLYEAGIPLSRHLSDFTVLVDSTGPRATGLALVNAGPVEVSREPASVRLRLYDPAFRLLAETWLELPYGGHLARYVDQLFPDLVGAREMRGVLTVSSSEPILAVTLRQSDDGGGPSGGGRPTLTAFPVIAGRADQ